MKKKLLSGVAGLMFLAALAMGFGANATANSGNYTPIYEPCYNPSPRIILFCLPNGNQWCYRQNCLFWP